GPGGSHGTSGASRSTAGATAPACAQLPAASRSSCEFVCAWESSLPSGTWVDSTKCASVGSASPDPASSAEQLIETLSACQPGSIVWQVTAGGMVSGTGTPGAVCGAPARLSVVSRRLGCAGAAALAGTAATCGEGSTRTFAPRGSPAWTWSSSMDTTPGATVRAGRPLGRCPTPPEAGGAAPPLKDSGPGSSGSGVGAGAAMTVGAGPRNRSCPSPATASQMTSHTAPTTSRPPRTAARGGQDGRVRRRSGGAIKDVSAKVGRLARAAVLGRRLEAPDHARRRALSRRRGDLQVGRQLPVPAQRAAQPRDGLAREREPHDRALPGAEPALDRAERGGDGLVLLGGPRDRPQRAGGREVAGGVAADG